MCVMLSVSLNIKGIPTGCKEKTLFYNSPHCWVLVVCGGFLCVFKQPVAITSYLSDTYFPI